MEYSRLSEKAVRSFRRGRIVKLVIALCAVGLVYGILRLFEAYAAARIFMIPGGIFLFGCILEVFIYPKLEYEQWRYLVTEDRVEILHGIIFRQKTILPIIRIQNISVNQGPINRGLELFDIQMATASGSFDIPCLEKEVSDGISENLKNRIYDRIRAREGSGS